MNKLRSLPALLAELSRLRRRGRKIVFTNGCFDIIHPGHVKVFAAAKALGDVLVVGLNRDASVRRLKGPTRPVVSERDRALVISALEPVDYIVFFGAATPRELIKKIKPDILVKGGDYAKKDIVGSEFAGRVARVSVLKGYSTSGIIAKIKKCAV